MVKLPALVSALAKHDERERTALDHFARVLREEGYIPSTNRRGMGAADMTVAAAVNLFLGLNGCDAPKDGPLTIDRFRSLKPRPMTLQLDDDDNVLRSVAEAENFGLALEALIESMPSVLRWSLRFIEGYEEEKAREVYRTMLLQSGWIPSINFEIVLQRYPWWAQISLVTHVGTSIEDSHLHTNFNAEFMVDINRFMEGFYGQTKSRKIAVTIPAKVLWDIWLTLNVDEKTTSTDGDGDE